ncbi:N-acetyltransferase [Salinisphaera sp. Q1T1-3]|uniref:N-acetyltransferase n=1 Tax=Salinisphaera sp. Q1T1-3 TaxID=2321229 RepID=UPI000E7195B5|nr:N-acetyltransferase [Salinisphaera sp. Q1T1-3]RJS92215.1 N-acetyltransferase [Salinisphaera sp. Q1T1-3]
MAAPHPDRAVQIVPVAGKRELTRFLKVPHTVYAKRREWRAPLMLERRMHLSEKQNPAFEHLTWQAWIAVRDGRDIGRITAQIDALRTADETEPTGFFGMFECIDDADAAAALMATAEAWLAERGMHTIQGPFNLTINDECGLLVDGFETPPMAMMPHGRDYYAGLVEQSGYHTAVDMLAFWLDLPFTRPRAMQRLLSRYAGRIRIRPIERKHYDRELDTLRDIFNDAWANNWGFVPFTQAEFRDLGHTLKLLIADDLVQIAEVDGHPAAFIVGLPNINEAARDLGGRLGPIGIGKLLWRLKVRFPKTVRVPLMGVRQAYQGGPLGAALAFGVIDAMETAFCRHGASGSELSWILADNHGMRDIIEALGGHAYKTYRMYEKTLT